LKRLSGDERGTAGPVAAVGLSVTHRVHLKRVGIAHMAFVILAVVHAASHTNLWSIQWSFHHLSACYDYFLPNIAALSKEKKQNF
jgi:hypothetical protein